MPPTVVERLLADHKMFRKILGDLDALAALPPARRDAAALRHGVDLIRRLVKDHAAYEDREFFPAAARTGKFSEADLAHYSHEHKTLADYLDRLHDETVAPTPIPTWPQTFALFRHGLEAHLRREETDLFPKVS
jgi:hemerythrin-like domain-containing protein